MHTFAQRLGPKAKTMKQKKKWNETGRISRTHREKQEPKWNRVTTTLSGKETENSTRVKTKQSTYRNHINTHKHIRIAVFKCKHFNHSTKAHEWMREGFTTTARIKETNQKKNNNKFELYKFSSSKILVTYHFVEYFSIVRSLCVVRTSSSNLNSLKGEKMSAFCIPLSVCIGPKPSFDLCQWTPFSMTN